VSELVKKLLKPKDVYSAIGISYDTLWRWIKSGKVNAVRINGRYYIPEDELRKIIES